MSSELDNENDNNNNIKMIRKLIEEALEARENAYAPYSKFKVGAALLTKEGKIYRGCNIENAAYSPSICAERTAISSAISKGDKDFTHIAIIAGNIDKGIKDYISPCGVCRQVLLEFCDKKNFKVILAKDVNTYKILTLEELMPYSFGADEL